MKKILFIPILFAFFTGVGQVKTTTKDKTKDSAIIGTPILIEGFLVAEHDFPERLMLNSAKAACLKLGKGWRLPSERESRILFAQSKNLCNGLSSYDWYWTLTAHHTFPSQSNWAFTSGNSNNYRGEFQVPIFDCKVRAVRDSGSMEIKLSPELLKAVDSAFIIGKAIILGKLVVAQHFFPNGMKWDEAMAICPLLGKGWRLPTKDELNILIQNHNKIGAREGGNYWSSTEDTSDDTDDRNAYTQWFRYDGIWAPPGDKTNTFYVWPVRDNLINKSSKK